jgi:parallel beta-helix repeat protein
MRRVLLALAALTVTGTAEAAHDCIFDVSGTTMALASDCRTDASIVIRDGMTLDGRNHTITAVDPPGGHFTGAILINGGRTASVINTRLVAQSLANVCDAGDGRLRGILLNGASGVLTGNTVLDINQGTSACQEGNGIEVWNFSGTPVVVEIADNVVDGYQKSGIVASGDVDATIHHNRVGPSAALASVPTNAVQIGFGAWSTIAHNHITGNRWPLSDAAATGILLSNSAPGTLVRQNTIAGNADVGIYIAAREAVVTRNVVIDDGVDGFYDIGIVSAGENNTVRDNDVRGYDQRYLGVDTEVTVPDGLQVNAAATGTWKVESGR